MDRQRQQRRVRRTSGLIGLLAGLLVLLGAPMAATAADPSPPFIPVDAPWLDTVNYYRAMAGLPKVVENTALNPGAVSHSCYMLTNGMSHDEDPSKPGYTAAGDIAGNNGNVAVSTVQTTTARSHIELWMTGPFHAIGILRPGLQSVGFGKCDAPSSNSGWRSGATLDIASGLVWAPPPTSPILFPGNGTTTSLSKFVTESPNPLTFCGWTGTAGLPVLALMPEPVTGNVTASISGPTGVLPTCAIHANNTTGTAQQILKYDNVVSVIPRNQLTAGTYTVTITTSSRTVTWSFTVDPNAATGIMPLPQVQPTGSTSGYTAITPFRFADSRDPAPLRITKLLANTPKRIRMSGIAGLPGDMTAVSANFTIVNRSTGTGGSYLTVYDCAANPPTASTVNFIRGEVIANAGVFPMSSSGDLCVFTPLDTDLIIDVNGYFRSGVTSSFTAMVPTPAIDTIKQLNSDGRTAAGETLSLRIYDAGLGIPRTATALAVIITGVQPSSNGYVTAFPCGANVPVVSNVNPAAATTRSNFALVPLPADGSGSLCVYTFADQDLRVDVLGYFTPSGSGSLQPSAPTRFVDTRDLYRAQMNLGTNGLSINANQTYRLDVAGQRGVPSTAKAVSLNVTTVQPTTSGSLTVWACDAPMPDAKSVSFASGRSSALAQAMQVKLSVSNGEMCMRSTASMHLVMDVNGWWY